MRKKIISIILLVAMVLTMTAGCGKKEDKKDYFVFYVNNELTKVVAKKITLQHTSSGKAQVKELLKDLQTQPEDATLRRTIPRKVKIQNIDLISYQITVDFSKEYYDMKPTEEILTQGCNCKDTVAAEPVCDLYCGWKTTCGCLGSKCRCHESGQFCGKSGRTDQFQPESNTETLFFK